MNKNLDFLKEKFDLKRLEVGRNDYLVKTGDVCSKLYCIEKGLFKARYLTIKGDEYIKGFMIEDGLISPSSSYLENKGSTYDVIALEDSVVFSLNLKTIFEAIALDHSVAIFISHVALELAAKKEAREYGFLCLSATEKWLNFPQELKGRVHLKDIASYIGITNVALSRIKGKTPIS